MTDEQKELDQALSKLSASFADATEKFDTEVESWWCALSQEDCEKAFYAVVKRIHQAEVVERRSYRGALYDVFGFDPGMYGVAMDCGYMAVHNAIFDGEELMAMQGAKEFEVIDEDGAQYARLDVKSLKVHFDDETKKLVVTINKGSNYV